MGIWASELGKKVNNSLTVTTPDTRTGLAKPDIIYTAKESEPDLILYQDQI